MRMHPGVSYPLERVVPEGGAELCGAHLPAGTIVGVNPAVIHRNQDIFGEDADQFRPERWLDEEARVKEMDRHLLTVSIRKSVVHIKLKMLKSTTVWRRREGVYW